MDFRLCIIRIFVHRSRVSSRSIAIITVRVIHFFQTMLDIGYNHLSKKEHLVKGFQIYKVTKTR